LEENGEWPFFLAVDFDSRERLAMFKDDPVYIKFVEETIKPNMRDHLELVYDADPKRKA
jgi:hypothetical protein